MKWDPAQFRKLFIASQFGLIFLLALATHFLLRKKDRPFFKPRPPQNPKDPQAGPKSGPNDRGPDLLAHARYERPEKKATLRLEGIRLTGPAHEVLGVQAQASEAEIQAAYRELMKRYHPDRVGRPGTREWQDAQGIAEALNRAKAELLAKAKKARK